MCGCARKRGGGRDRRRTAAAMCEVCPSGVLGATRYGVGVVECSISGRSISVAVTQKCPRGRHPDRDGVIVWAGVRWIGLPMPLRILLRWAHPKRPGVKSWAGCGCVLVLKRGLEFIGSGLRLMTLPALDRSAIGQGRQEALEWQSNV